MLDYTWASRALLLSKALSYCFSVPRRDVRCRVNPGREGETESALPSVLPQWDSSSGDWPRPPGSGTQVSQLLLIWVFSEWLVIYFGLGMLWIFRAPDTPVWKQKQHFLKPNADFSGLCLQMSSFSRHLLKNTSPTECSGKGSLVNSLGERCLPWFPLGDSCCTVGSSWLWEILLKRNLNEFYSIWHFPNILDRRTPFCQRPQGAGGNSAPASRYSVGLGSVLVHLLSHWIMSVEGQDCGALGSSPHQ